LLRTCATPTAALEQAVGRAPIFKGEPRCVCRRRYGARSGKPPGPGHCWAGGRAPDRFGGRPGREEEVVVPRSTMRGVMVCVFLHVCAL